MVQGWPDDLQFTNTIGASLRPARGAGERKVRVFDEMVAILWAGGYDAATIRLEKFWHEACHQQGFALFCAYPRVCFPAGPSEPMSRVLATHSKVLVG
jgi:hypothetical protein